MKLPYIFITIGCVLLVLVLHQFKILEDSELKSIDNHFKIRNSLFKEPQISKDIVIIGIDDHSISETEEPFILWDTFFAEIIEKVSQQQPKVIGLDIIWSKSIDKFLPRPAKQKNALRKALLIAINKYQIPIIIGVAAGVKNTGDDKGEVFDSSLPMKHFGLIVGKYNFGVINTYPDSDNTIRRVRQTFKSALDQDILGFPLLIANKALSSQIEIPTTRNIQIINYQLNLQIQQYSFYDVLLKARENDTHYFKQNFAGKIVLIALNNVSDDIHASPLGDETPGIFIHAHTINNHLNHNYIYQVDEKFLLLLLMVGAFISVFIALRYKLIIASVIFISIILTYIIISILLFNSNIIIPTIPILLSMLLSFLSVFIYRFTVEDKSKRRLAHFFRSYVNDQVVDDILKSETPITLHGSREKVCILFADIRNFTTYSENHSPEVVVSALNEYFSVMTDVVLKHAGTIDKFIGDGLMVFFGAPIEIMDNPTLHAAKAAIEMQKSLIELNQKWTSEGKANLQIGIGLHTGEAIIGNIGSDKKMEYTAIGDAVNIASRVEGLTKSLDSSILITINSYDEIKSFVEVIPKGDEPIKGHTKVEVFELIKIMEK